MRKKRICYSILIVIIVVISSISFIRLRETIYNNEEIKTEIENKIEEMKNEVGISGNNNIYEIQKEYDGKEVLNVKKDLKFEVAFVGMIKQELPKMEEIEYVFSEECPKKNGIWIEKNSREKLLNQFNNSMFKSKYTINQEGYLEMTQEQMNENDKKIQQIIQSKQQYILSISSNCYIIDQITGEIIDYSFENMDKYQIYEYFENENKKIIFITENTKQQLKEQEIINSLLELLES